MKKSVFLVLAAMTVSVFMSCCYQSKQISDVEGVEASEVQMMHHIQYAHTADHKSMVPVGIIDIGEGLCVAYAIVSDSVIFGSVEPLRPEYNGAAFIPENVDKVGGRLVACEGLPEGDGVYLYKRGENPIDRFETILYQRRKTHDQMYGYDNPIVGVVTNGSEATVKLYSKGKLIEKTFSYRNVPPTIEEELGL